jgi:hypothetical protein
MIISITGKLYINNSIGVKKRILVTEDICHQIFHMLANNVSKQWHPILKYVIISKTKTLDKVTLKCLVVIYRYFLPIACLKIGKLFIFTIRMLQKNNSIKKDPRGQG